MTSMRRLQLGGVLAAGLLFCASGCRSPYRADQGALLGGLTGAGLGAIVGNAVDNPLAGAIIGGGVGAMTGSVVGGSLDEIEAQNRAEIEARLGRPVAAGSVTISDVISMTQAGVDENVIVNHVRIHGSAKPLSTNDLILLGQSSVSPRVIEALQNTPAPPAAVAVAPAAPPKVIVEEHYYDRPWGWHPYVGYHHHHHRRHRHHDGVSWGFSFSN